MVARREGDWGLGEKGEGMRRTNRQLQKSHRGVQYSIGNINNTVITMVPGGYWKYRGEHLLTDMTI